MYDCTIGKCAHHSKRCGPHGSTTKRPTGDEAKQKRCWLTITIHLKSQISWKKVCVWQNPETCEAMWDSPNVERQSLTTVALLFPTALLIVGLLGKGNDFFCFRTLKGCSFSSFIGQIWQHVFRAVVERGQQRNKLSSTRREGWGKQS